MIYHELLNYHDISLMSYSQITINHDLGIMRPFLKRAIFLGFQPASHRGPAAGYAPSQVSREAPAVAAQKECGWRSGFQSHKHGGFKPNKHGISKI
jgi:hypothetical protein